MMGMPGLPLDPVGLTLYTVSWTVGMVAMMFPTAVPMVMMFFRVGKSANQEIRAGGGPTLTKASLFTISYIAIWAAVGVLIYVAGAILSSLFWPGMFALLASPVGTGLALLIVGIYQISPLKGECLDRCHPTSFLFRYYRGGSLGAAQMGGLYAKYCVGCCWVMMVFLLLVGAMGVVWMALFALLIFFERVVLHKPWTSRAIGLAFLLSGIFFLLSGRGA